MTSRKDDTKYHEKLKQASIYVYHGGNAQLPLGYRVIDKAENTENGFYAEAYSNGKDIIIAYRGTDNNGIRAMFSDLANDNDMAYSQLPNQCIDAVRFYDKVANNNKNSDITVTGHSLGGSNAEIVSAIRGSVAVTFNAYGVRDMFTPYTKLKEDNIVNYVNEMDVLTMVNGHNHLGKIYSVSNAAEHTVNKFNYHKAEEMGDLSQRIERTPAEIKEKSERIHPNVIKLKNRYNSVRGTYDKSVNMVNSGIDKVMTTANKIKNKVSECVGSYPVSGYTREDGTKVNGYTRTCGAKHNN